MGVLDRLLQEAASRLAEAGSEGVSVVPDERLKVLESAISQNVALRRQLDLLGYSVLNDASGVSNEVLPQARRVMTRKAGVAWMSDPQIGAAVDRMNDFTLGRGVSKPKARDKAVQSILDEVWEDADNRLVLTSPQAQVKVNTDLSLQSNVFILFFDQGVDGKVKLGVLRHDTVETAIGDPDNFMRVLYFLTKQQEWVWNPNLHQYEVPGNVMPKWVYYPHWENLRLVQEALADGTMKRDKPLPEIPDQEVARAGVVYHLVINARLEGHFGVPQFERVLRWASAFNDFMAARVDTMKAQAAFVMKTTVKGTPGQVQKLAQQSLAMASEVGVDAPVGLGPAAGSILYENESAKTEPFKIDTGSAGAMQDAQMLRSNFSAGTGLPQSYLGDASASNLATATSLELPVLKMIEARQEVLEGLFRALFDRAISRAVDLNMISDTLTPAEQEQRLQEGRARTLADVQQRMGRRLTEAEASQVVEAYDGQVDDEAATKRDLGYDFALPNPLKRMMAELVAAACQVAQIFDPNGTNTELSRILLRLILAEAFELQDVDDLVAKVYPPGYQDPTTAMQQGGGAGGNLPQLSNFVDTTGQGTPGADGELHTPDNPYGGPMKSQTPEQAMEGVVRFRRRDGQLVEAPLRRRGVDVVLEESRVGDLPGAIQASLRARQAEAEGDFEQDWEDEVVAAVAKITGRHGGSNGDGAGY